jgi:hypothetical protein
MKKIILFINCLLCFEFINAQVPSFEWAKSVGDTLNDYGKSIICDPSGNVYSTGSFSGIVDFDPGAGVYNLTSAGNFDVYILKLDNAGNFIWAKSVGGVSSDLGASIALDAFGNIYITGEFTGVADFNPGPSLFNLTSGFSYTDIFILKLDASGNLVWAKGVGSSSIDHGFSISVDVSGNVYTTGQFVLTADFDPNGGVFNLTSVGSFDIFILKLDALGNFVWAKNIGGSASDCANSIAIDALGNIYTTGYFIGAVDFNPNLGLFNITSLGSYDMYILKLDALGNFVWAKNIGGGSSTASSRSIKLDIYGNIYTTGFFGNTVDFDPGAAVSNLTALSGDVFISKLDASGNFVWAKSIGGVASDEGSSIDVDPSGNVYTTGYFQGTADFDPGAGVYSLSFVSSQDVFVLKLDTSGNFVWAEKFGGYSGDYGQSIALDASNNVYTTGWFGAVVDFDPTVGFDSIASFGGNDIFIHKLSQPPTGINEEINFNNISIYPNPNNGTFNISLSSQIKNASIEVCNYLGALVYKQEIVNQENSIELSNQANGLYFVKVMTENKIVGMGKIVKQ